MTCEYCDDGEGGSVFPYYGLAPHKHDMSQGSFIGSTRIEPKSTWPKNFEPDPENEGAGVYTHCLHCGEPKEQP